jgi:hypothetical protein
MNRFLPFRGPSRNAHRRDKKSRRRASRPDFLRGRLERLEGRQMLTGAWAAAFANGQLTIQAGTLSSATGVLKLDPNQEILLDGNNSGNFVDTGANMATITGTIQIDANTSVNSNFIIDNHAGAFFEAPASFPAGTPLFNYTGSTALRPNDSLTVRGVGGVAESFEVALDATSNVIANNTTTGESGTVVLTEPPTPLNQQNQLTVTFGPNLATSPNSTGITGHLTLDGVNANGANQLFIDDQGATINPIAAGLPTKPGTASDWTLNGTSIAGPQFPPAPTVPPTTNPPPGLVGNITYANIANLQFNDNVAGDLLTINSVATNTTASDLVANYTVVNYNQPLAFPVNIQGVQGTAGGTLDIVGAVNGNNDFYVDDHSVALAATGTKPQYNTPFTHLGADLTYTLDSLSAMNVAGNGGDNIVTVQVPPTLNPPFPSDTLPAAFTVYGGALPPPPVLKGAKPVLVTPRTNFLRVFGNAPGPLTTGADSITVNDLAGGAAAGGNVILMSQITGVVLYGEGGDDTLTNSSVGNVKTGLSPVPALFIPGDGNATLTGGGGSDMFLGGNGQYTISSKAVSTPAKTTTNYYFPHQDQFGNIYDPLLNPNVGNTTSMLTGAGGNEVVVTGSVDPSISVAVDPITGTTVGDLDTGNLANPGVGGKPGGGGVTAATGGTLLSYSTVPPTNVTAPLYMVTDALSALEQAMGIARGPFPANVPAELEFGGSLNLRAQFASPAAFVGRAYNDFLVDRAGAGGTFGAAQTNGGSTSAGPEGGAVVSQAEIDNAANLIQNHQLTVQSLQADLLASDELRQLLPGPSQWVRSLYEAVTGSPPTDQQFTADVNMLTGGDTTAARFNLALALLNSPEGQAIEIQDAYTNVVPGASALTPKAPSPTDLVAIQADLASGESLPQVAQIMGASSGNYLSYEEANDVGTVGYVANVYQSVLHRPASTIDLLFWAGQRGVGVSNASIAFTVLSSPEAKMYVVINAYERYLGRDPDASGLAFWQAQLTSGLSDEGFISLIVSSPEYYAKYGNTSAGYVTGLYHDLLQRGTTQQEIDYWVTQLAASPRGAVQARADIALGFMQSPEYQTLLIDAWYQQFDGRAPTEAELVAALQTFNTGAGDEQVAAQILAARARS